MRWNALRDDVLIVEESPLRTGTEVWRRVSQCPSGKWRYRDEIAAKMALTTVRRQDKSWRPKLEQRVYRCHLCRGWHTTSQSARPKRKPS